MSEQIRKVLGNDTVISVDLACLVVCNPSERMADAVDAELDDRPGDSSVAVLRYASGFCDGPKGELLLQGFRCALQTDCLIDFQDSAQRT